MSAIASSSRPLLRASTTASSSIRTVVHFARSPRVPALRSPHNPKQPLPTSGTSHPDPSSGRVPITIAQLEGSNLTLHHAPPPSAPSYTTGAAPPFIRWINGESVQLTGEEKAPLRIARRGPGLPPAWDSQVRMQIKDMRARGMTRLQIAQSLNIPPAQMQHIARVAELSDAQRLERQNALDEQKSQWGQRKLLAQAMRTKRKALWQQEAPQYARRARG